MIDGVHYHAAHMRSSSAPAGASCFAARNIHMIDVPNLANRREAIFVNPPNFARWHFHQRVSGFECSKRGLLPGTTRHLTATTRSQFNVVNTDAQRNCTERQRIPQIRRNINSGNNSRSNLKTVRRENVTQFAIGIFNESNTRRTIRIVFDPDHFRRDIVLAPFKIDFAIVVFVAAANVSRCQPATVIAATAFFLRLEKTLFRAPLCNFIEGRKRLETQCWR